MDTAQIEKLITLVKSYPQLYDCNHKEYSDLHRRDSIWKQIGERMNRPSQFCRAKWTNLRSGYRKTLSNASVEPDQCRRKWRFEDEMVFLKQFIQRKSLFESNENSVNISDMLESDDEIFTVEVKEEADNKMALEDDMVTSGDSMPLAEVVKTVEEQYSHTQRERREERDAVTHFFLSMAETVKTLPPLKQAEVKAQVFKCINSVEIKYLEEKEAEM